MSNYWIVYRINTCFDTGYLCSAKEFRNIKFRGLNSGTVKSAFNEQIIKYPKATTTIFKKSTALNRFADSQINIGT